MGSNRCLPVAQKLQPVDHLVSGESRAQVEKLPDHVSHVYLLRHDDASVVLASHHQS